MPQREPSDLTEICLFRLFNASHVKRNEKYITCVQFNVQNKETTFEGD